MKKLLVLLLLVSPCFAEEINPHLTPGVARKDCDAKMACETKWGLDKRAVTPAMKKEVFTAYGFLSGNADPRCPCEIDHLISRELCGADDVKNLWPQPYSGPSNAHDKDRVENRIHAELCAGRITLLQAQKEVIDWKASWRKYFTPK